ncbi:hypothetical protein MMC09_004723 [Bachmanniomyces sp. S44760]|nr:hypothetical protein [Bachmanniomyces sp. S44760]
MDARIRYLDEAAKAYVTLAPATSAYLGLCQAVFRREQEKPLRASEEHGACTACGTLLRPGENCEVKILAQGKADSNSTKRSDSHDTISVESTLEHSIITECVTCRRYTKVASPSNRNVNQTNRSSIQGAVTESATPHLAIQTRAKARKGRAKERKNGGLQALLAKSKEQNQRSAGFGLDLMDLMKKS